MNPENECVSKRSERIFEVGFSLITGSVGGFFVFVSIWFLKGTIEHHNIDGIVMVFLSILFLIAYWFLKLTYKLAFHKASYLLSTTELKITGWFFILFPVVATVDYLAYGKVADLVKYLPPTLPGCLYGYYALKVAKNRTAASNQEDAPDPKPVR